MSSPITLSCTVQTTGTRLLANADGTVYPVEDIVLSLNSTDTTNQTSADASAEARIEIDGLKPTDWIAGQNVMMTLRPLD